MPDPDFESILKKYRSLLGPGSAAEEKPVFPAIPDQKGEGSKETVAESDNDRLLKEDTYLLAERFIRAPLSNEKLDPPPSDIYNNLLFNHLFAAEDGSWDTPASFMKSVQVSDKIEMDPESVEFARRLYHQKMDLRQNYNPELGMYPGQAFYVPRHVSDRHSFQSKEEPASLSNIWPDLKSDDDTMSPPPPLGVHPS